MIGESLQKSAQKGKAKDRAIQSWSFPMGAA